MSADDAVGVDPDLLATVPLLHGLGAADRARLAADTVVHRVPAGTWVFRRGDPGDSVLLVLSGRLEILDGDGAVIRVLAAPSAVGELALLTGAPRTASVRVRRDADLLHISAERFDQLLADAPGLGVALARYLARLLQQGPAGRGGARRDSVVAVTGDGARVPLVGFAEAVVAAAGRWCSVGLLTPGTPGVAGALEEPGWAAALDAAEREHTLVVLVADLRDGEPAGWLRFCLRQADRTLTLLDDGEAADRHTGLAGGEVVLVRAGARRRVPAWIAELALRGLHSCDVRAMAEAAAGIARRITGRSVGLVLSGGGARALAHIGVLDTITERGLVVDRLAGTGTGALVAGLAALGRTPDEIAEFCRVELAEARASDYTVPLVALTRGRRQREMLERAFGTTRIEDLPREFFCLSSDLVGGTPVVHRRGLLAEAVACSSVLPGIAPPVASRGRLLVHGGLLDNLPVGVMAADADGPIVAVDVGSPLRWPPSDPTRRARRGASWLRARLTGTPQPLPGIGEIMTRVITLGGAGEADPVRADLTIRPSTAHTGLLEWSRLEVLRAAGRSAAQQAWDAHGPLLPRS